MPLTTFLTHPEFNLVASSRRNSSLTTLGFFGRQRLGVVLIIEVDGGGSFSLVSNVDSCRCCLH